MRTSIFLVPFKYFDLENLDFLYHIIVLALDIFLVFIVYKTYQYLKELETLKNKKLVRIEDKNVRETKYWKVLSFNFVINFWFDVYKKWSTFRRFRKKYGGTWIFFFLVEHTAFLTKTSSSWAASPTWQKIDIKPLIWRSSSYFLGFLFVGSKRFVPKKCKQDSSTDLIFLSVI